MGRRAVARLGVALVCTIGAIAGGAFALSQARYSSQSPPLLQHYDVPADLVPDYYWACYQTVPERADDGEIFGTSIDTGADGVMQVEIGIIDPEDGTMTVNAEYSAAINECLAGRTVDVARDVFPTSAVARMQMYRWAHEWQGPCLRNLGWTVPPASFDAFMSDDNAPWYLWRGAEPHDFEDLLAARLACPPVPPFLRASDE